MTGDEYAGLFDRLADHFSARRLLKSLRVMILKSSLAKFYNHRTQPLYDEKRLYVYTNYGKEGIRRNLSSPPSRFDRAQINCKVHKKPGI